MKLRFLVLALAFALAFFAPSASAVDWWEDACDNYTPVTGVLGGSTAQTGTNQWTGCIQAPELVAGPAGTNWDGFKLAWDIVINPNSTVDYNYRIFGLGTPEVSHFILGLSDNCLTDLTNVPSGERSCIWDLATTDGITFDPAYGFGGGAFGPGPGNPGFPAGKSIEGIKFDDLNGVNDDDLLDFGFSFTSSRLPVWQNFYGKGGKSDHVYNSGLNGGQYFVLAPNGVGVVPEPGFYGMLSVGIAGLFLAVRRRRNSA
jgi:hypothetical protein